MSPGCFIAFYLACSETRMWHWTCLKEVISYMHKIRPEREPGHLKRGWFVWVALSPAHRAATLFFHSQLRLSRAQDHMCFCISFFHPHLLLSVTLEKLLKNQLSDKVVPGQQKNVYIYSFTEPKCIDHLLCTWFSGGHGNIKAQNDSPPSVQPVTKPPKESSARDRVTSCPR